MTEIDDDDRYIKNIHYKYDILSLYLQSMYKQAALNK